MDKIYVRQDAEGDFLFVSHTDGDGDMFRTQDNKAMVKVDVDGNILSFQIFDVSKRRETLAFSILPDDTALVHPGKLGP